MMRVESIGIHVTHPVESQMCAKIVVEAMVCVGEEQQVFRVHHECEGREDITGTDMDHVEKMIRDLFEMIRKQLSTGFLTIPVKRDNAFRGSRQVPLSGIITMRKVH